MRRFRRWLVVAAGIAVLAALPAVVAAVPGRDADQTPTELQALANRSSGVGFTGYAEATGGLGLPVTTNQFSTVADLLGGHTQLRVWWRGPSDARIDTINPAGESDLHLDDIGSWTWNYEANLATRTDNQSGAQVRIPVAADLVPASLGRRLLSEARPAELSRLPARRIAGRNAPGVRIKPTDTGTTIDHVDIWIDATTGVPLRVDVADQPNSIPVLSTQFLDFTTGAPDPATTEFILPRTARIEVRPALNLSTALNRFTNDTSVPDTLADIARNTELPNFVGAGVYGHGITEFVAVPLTGRAAAALRRQLITVPDVVENANGDAIAVGPVSLLLTSFSSAGSFWLLTGTVTAATLDRAADDLNRFGGGG